jgi:hypothetical protein
MTKEDSEGCKLQKVESGKENTKKKGVNNSWKMGWQWKRSNLKNRNHQRVGGYKLFKTH